MLKFTIDIVNVLKRDITPIFTLLSLTVITRVLLIANATAIYYFDSYAYISKAIDFSSRGEIQFGVGMPFILCLGVLFYIFGSGFGVILVSRLLMLFMSILLVYFIYSFGLRISGKILGFTAALLAIFEPYFLMYSIVPHNDVFVVALTFAALYLIASKDMKFHYALALIIFYTVAFTRPEFFVVLLFPILAFFSFRFLEVVSFRNMIKFAFFGSLFVLPVIWVDMVYPAATRFDIIEKFSLFLTPSMLKLTLESLFKFYDHAFLNQLFFALLVLGVVWVLLTTLGKIVVVEKREKTFSIRRKKNKGVREILLSDGAKVASCLFLLFFVHIIILTTYGYGYVIVEGTLIIKTSFPVRYLVLDRVLLSYPLAYVLSMIVQEVYARVAHKK